MTLREAFLLADMVVCHTCQEVKKHSVSIDTDNLLIVFVCDTCGDECDETCVDFAERKQP